MNVKKNGKTLNKTGWIQNTLLGKIVKVHSLLSMKSNGSDNIAPYLFDENTRKTVKAAQLEAERWRAEADKLKLNMC